MKLVSIGDFRTEAGATLADARADAYATVDGIEFAGGFVRRDIGKRAEDGEISL